MTLTLSKSIALRAQLHFRGKIPLLWLFLPKIHNLSPIKRKHQTNPSWGAFNKIAGQLILFWNKLEPLLSYSVDLEIGLGTLLPGVRKIGHSVGVLTCNLVREQWVFSWVMGIILDKWLEPWILVSALSWQMPPRYLSVKWWYLFSSLRIHCDHVEGLFDSPGMMCTERLIIPKLCRDPVRWEAGNLSFVGQSTSPPSLLAVMLAGGTRKKRRGNVPDIYTLQLLLEGRKLYKRCSISFNEYFQSSTVCQAGMLGAGHMTLNETAENLCPVEVTC